METEGVNDCASIYVEKKSKRGRRRMLAALLVCVIFIFGVWSFLSYSVNPIIRKISEEKVRELSSIAINSAAVSVLNETGADYASVINTTINDAGEIEMLQVNSVFLNAITQQLVSYAQTNISALGAQGISVPLGSLSGLTFLSGRGPDVSIKIYPVGSVSITFDSKFISAGINQTRHRINLLVKADISVIMPGSNRTVTTRTELTLLENVIVGKVPLVYLHSNAISEMLNLVP